MSQTLEKPCEYFRGPIVSTILIKLRQYECRNEILVDLEYGSCGVKE